MEMDLEEVTKGRKEKGRMELWGVKDAEGWGTVCTDC
jgi:hypothetical protein